MTLTFPKIKSIFPQNERDDVGISSKGRERNWNCTGTHFLSTSPDTNAINYEGDSGTVQADANGIFFTAPVFLPDGAVINAAVVFVNAAAQAETWELERMDIGNTPSTNTIASANIGTEDKSIVEVSTVDNKKFSYHFITTSLDTNDVINGARITYTI